MCYNGSAGGWFDSAGQGPYDNPVSRARLARCLELGRTLNATAGQVALAWLIAQPFPVFPIIGTSKPSRLTEALAASRLRLSPEQVQWLQGGPLVSTAASLI